MKLSMVGKSEPLTLETSEGEVNLMVTELTYNDITRHNELIKHMYDEKNQIKDSAKLIDLTAARVMCAIKNLDGTYYFNQVSVEEYLEHVADAPGDFTLQLNDVVTRVNPYQLPEDTLESKKKPS